ncbi:virion structural protein [Variovorax phage VAC_51]|uniref:Virion structural protein n=1 Tax=Variovorax phage VAC_51 TaxID=2985242 RepID=A0A9N6WVM1_9CAUD|nr:virion structural protein [Variovorax phage VAC_51]
MGKSKKGPTAQEQMLQMIAMVQQQNAQAESQRIAAEGVAQQKELANINKNMSADLTNENRAVVEVAGAANDADTVTNPDQKRKRTAAGLASTLGIN